MPLSQFLKQLYSHVTAASTALFVILVALEFFVPGAVLPFVHLANASIILIMMIGGRILMVRV